MRLLMLCDDLIFASRVRATALAAGGEFRSARDVAQLLHTATDWPPRCVVVDLQNVGTDIESLMRSLRALATPPLVVGYGSHVDAEALRAARAAGCDAVMPRSQFVERLESAMPGWLAVSE